METSLLIATAPSPSIMEDNSAVTVIPIASRQHRNVLYNRDLCRIITTFIPSIFHEKDDDDKEDEEDGDEDNEKDVWEDVEEDEDEEN